MHILPLLLLLPLIFSSLPPSFQDIIHDLDHFKLTFQSQSLDSLLNGSALVPPPPSPFVSSSSSFLPSHTTIPTLPQNHHPTDQECGSQNNCGGECDGICVACLLTGELGWKCLKNLKISNLQEP